jgi:hypothetical protein
MLPVGYMTTILPSLHYNHDIFKEFVFNFFSEFEDHKYRKTCQEGKRQIPLDYQKREIE